jgi:hypothetical protein
MVNPGRTGAGEPVAAPSILAHLGETDLVDLGPARSTIQQAEAFGPSHRVVRPQPALREHFMMGRGQVEKELTRRSDELARRRQELPWR